jgi:hypothetical protein
MPNLLDVVLGDAVYTKNSGRCPGWQALFHQHYRRPEYLLKTAPCEKFADLSKPGPPVLHRVMHRSSHPEKLRAIVADLRQRARLVLWASQQAVSPVCSIIGHESSRNLGTTRVQIFLMRCNKPGRPESCGK